MGDLSYLGGSQVTEVYFKRLRNPMGVVTDTKYISCYWPFFDVPTAIFSQGSSGIRVQGNVVPRNIIFPDDTIFEDFHPDALYPAEKAVKNAFPQIKGLINLTPEQSAIYKQAYALAVASLPPTCSVHRTVGDCYYLKHEDVDAGIVYVSPLVVADAKNIAKGQTNFDTIIAKPETKFYPVNEEIKQDSSAFKLSKSNGKYVVSADAKVGV